MPPLKGNRKTARSRHRSSKNTFISNQDFLNELELQEVFNELDLIGHDEDSEIVEETFITEKDIDVVDEIVLEAEIKAIQLCFQHLKISKTIDEALNGKGIGPMKRHILSGHDIAQDGISRMLQKRYVHNRDLPSHKLRRNPLDLVIKQLTLFKKN